jgi:hypothetical protein
MQIKTHQRLDDLLTTERELATDIGNADIELRGVVYDSYCAFMEVRILSSLALRVRSVVHLSVRFPSVSSCVANAHALTCFEALPHSGAHDRRQRP